jgi:ADP-ribose pyrophosphatase YjhB (NUDIX family)
MNRRVAVRGVIVYEQKLLCIINKQYGQPFAANDFWCTFGGGVDEGEALIPALERELVEETGIKPKIGSLLYIQQFIHKETEHLEFFFNIENVADYLDINLSKSTHGELEIAKIEFVEPEITNILPKFLQTEDYSHIDKNPATKIFNYINS